MIERQAKKGLNFGKKKNRSLFTYATAILSINPSLKYGLGCLTFFFRSRVIYVKAFLSTPLSTILHACLSFEIPYFYITPDCVHVRGYVNGKKFFSQSCLNFSQKKRNHFSKNDKRIIVEILTVRIQ